MGHTKSFGLLRAVFVLSVLAFAGGNSFAQSRVPHDKPFPGSEEKVPAADAFTPRPHHFTSTRQPKTPFDKSFEASDAFDAFVDRKAPDVHNIDTDITDAPKAPSSYEPKRSSGRWVIPDGATEYGVEFGFAPQVATWMSGPKYYDTSDRQHLLGSVRWGKILGTRAFVTYSWAIEIQPINIAFGNEVDNPRYLAGSVGEPRRNYEATYGVGINPASFRFIFFPQYRLRPLLGAGFGIVRHLKRVPTVEGTKFNFQADFHIGAQYMLKENKALNFGYRYYHLSNLYLFNFNPGYNVNMFFVGYSVFK